MTTTENPAAETTAITALTDRVGSRREERAADAGAPDWDRWWADVDVSGLFTHELQERAEVFGRRDRTPAPTRDVHLDALTAAGFTAPAVVWQDLDELLIAAVA